MSVRPRASPVDIELDAAAFDDLLDPSPDEGLPDDAAHAITAVSIAGFGATGTPAAIRALVPATIGKYAIVREIGRGTTSTVYLGIDPFTRREVAIKVVRPPASHDADDARRFRKAFLNEASLAGRLAHPHVVDILDAGVPRHMASIRRDRLRVLMEVALASDPGGGPEPTVRVGDKGITVSGPPLAPGLAGRFSQAWGRRLLQPGGE